MKSTHVLPLHVEVICKDVGSAGGGLISGAASDRLSKASCEPQVESHKRRLSKTV